MTKTTLDIFIRTSAAGHNRHVAAIKDLLIDHGVRWYMQYRRGGGGGVAIVVEDTPIPPECRKAIEALELPRSALVRIAEEA